MNELETDQTDQTDQTEQTGQTGQTEQTGPPDGWTNGKDCFDEDLATSLRFERQLVVKELLAIAVVVAVVVVRLLGLV